MDLFKSAASLLSKSIPAFPYTIQDKVFFDDSIWTLHNGFRKEDSSKCSIFQFEILRDRGRLPLARNAVRKLKTTRHPGVVKFLDSVETDQFIYLATERVEPLSWSTKRGVLDQEIIKWGLYDICKTIKFLNEEATSIHGNVRLSSIFISKSSEWKLFGFEVLTNVKDENVTYSGLLPQAKRYAAPEVGSNGWSGIQTSHVSSTDAFALGVLIYTLFNGSFDAQSELAFKNSIPGPIYPHYKNLLNPNPKSRLSTKEFIDYGLRHGSFFKGEVITFSEEISSLGIMNPVERERVLNKLEEISGKFPEGFTKSKILPELLKVLEFGGGGAKIFSMIINLSSQLTSDDFQSLVSPTIVRMFSSADREIRICLLENLDKIIDNLEKKTVNDKIFPNVLMGFSDPFPVVRELTIKSVLTIIPKLTDRNINNDLLRGLAKVQNDVQPGIRTNTTICLGMIARYLGENTRRKVLSAAFTRSLKDPFPPARNASLLALSATMDMFPMEDCAVRILPGVIPSLIDKDKSIRAQAGKTVDIYMSRVKLMANNIPEVIAAPEGEKTQIDGWAGWAVSGMKKMAAERLAAAASIPPSIADRPSSTPLKLSNPPLSVQSNNFPNVVSSEPITAGATPLPLNDYTIWDEDSPVWDDFQDSTEVGDKLKPKDDGDNAWENDWGLDDD
ncbi:putative inactive serine/threonine-protein kinase scy1 [Neolecta irregularis DAH-3]|uniref:Putative inactive serine/threonine-protein kinase scy1 n=1 Tax=Neolecta irregularis (strain DAH-3) TaxID=1198029 RepID=A0A1U7LIG0_NEOID|nr:putative inactive serine/threonine-protein kinase scy1 [Neolecta irregularis DAH-3]|eukprot:OLL22429.1 putative inactive serine/threonine-protein kinase scy1 [Neolecta irregularis DAH-3]